MQGCMASCSSTHRPYGWGAVGQASRACMCTSLSTTPHSLHHAWIHGIMLEPPSTTCLRGRAYVERVEIPQVSCATATCSTPVPYLLHASMHPCTHAQVVELGQTMRLEACRTMRQSLQVSLPPKLSPARPTCCGVSLLPGHTSPHTLTHPNLRRATLSSNALHTYRHTRTRPTCCPNEQRCNASPLTPNLPLRHAKPSSTAYVYIRIRPTCCPDLPRHAMP